MLSVEPSPSSIPDILSLLPLLSLLLSLHYYHFITITYYYHFVTITLLLSLLLVHLLSLLKLLLLLLVEDIWLEMHRASLDGRGIQAVNIVRRAVVV